MIRYCVISGHDNHSYYFEKTDAPACSACGLVTNTEWVNPDFRPRKTSLDLSYTYDLAPIASERFARFASAYAGCRFIRLPAADGFYLMTVQPIVPFTREGTTMIDECPSCHRFTQIAAPGIPLPGADVPNGFSRSDIVYGSAHTLNMKRKTSQDPVILVDPELGQALKVANLRGLIVRPVNTAPN
jgi:hypothetical protein